MNKKTVMSDAVDVTWRGKSWHCLSLQLLLSRVTGNLTALNHINLLPVWGQMSNVNWDELILCALNGEGSIQDLTFSSF